MINARSSVALELKVTEFKVGKLFRQASPLYPLRKLALRISQLASGALGSQSIVFANQFIDLDFYAIQDGKCSSSTQLAGELSASNSQPRNSIAVSCIYCC